MMVFRALTVSQLTFVSFVILSEVWLTTNAISNQGRPYYEVEQERLNKILLRYDKQKAELDGGNTTVYITSLITDVKDFSENKHEVTLDLFVAVAWKELNIQAWNTTPHLIDFVFGNKLWIPKTGLYHDDPIHAYVAVRNDQIIYAKYAYKIKANCWPRRTSYLNPRFKCSFRLNLRRFTTYSPRYRCVHSVYSLLNNLKSKTSDLRRCKKTETSKLWIGGVGNTKGWRYSKVTSRIWRGRIKLSFYMSRRQLHNLTPDIVGSIAMGFIISCQFLMTITGGYRFLIGLFGLLIATDNVIATSELPGALPLPLELGLGFLLLQVMALAWCLVAWCLQWRAVKVTCNRQSCFRHSSVINGIREWISEVNMRQQDCNRMQRLIDDNVDEEVAEIESGKAEESPVSGESGQQGESSSAHVVWEWNEIVIVIDRLLFVICLIVIIVLCSVF